MLRDQILSEGIKVGRRHVTTLMQRMSIEALCPQPGSSKPAPGHKVFPYLLRKLVITRPNQVWALKTAYIPMARGFDYPSAVVDVFSRRVLAHKVAIGLEAFHAREIVEQALAKYGADFFKDVALHRHARQVRTQVCTGTPRPSPLPPAPARL